MRFGVVIPSYGPWADPAMIRGAVRAAEEEGFDTAWFGDHIVIPDYASHVSDPHWVHPLSAILVAAGITERIRLATDVLVLPYRNPVELSQILASGDQLSGGRITIGAGIGYIKGEFDAVGAPPYDQRGKVTDEFLRAMRTLWESKGPTSFDGEWVSFSDVHAAPPPLQDPFPVWVGGNGSAGRRRAASLGNGWHPLFPTPDDYARGRREIEEMRNQQGPAGSGSQPADPFTYSYSSAATQVLMGSEKSTFYEVSAYSGPSAPPEYSYAPAPPRDESGRLHFVGTPSQILEDVELYAKAGVEHVALRFWAYDPAFGLDDFRAQLERFSNHVIR